MPPLPPFPPRTPTPTPPPPRPPRRWGLRIYAILMTLLFAGSLFIIFSLIMMVIVGALGSAMNMHSTTSRVQAEVLVSGRTDKIAVLPISGTIDANMYEQVRNFCNFILNDDTIKAVIVEVDSPGGYVTASDEIYYELCQLKESRKLVVSMRSMAASGGYYVAAAGDKLYAQPTTITGSIGVIMTSFHVADLMKKIGVTPETIKSSNANDYKDAGSPFREMTDEDRDYFRGLLNSMHDKFASIVDTSRKGKLTKPIEEIAIGKVWTAADAKTLGLIDEIAYLDQVWTNTAHEVGITNPTIIRLRTRVSLMDVLGASSPLGGKVEVNLKQLEDKGFGAMEFRFTGTR